MAGTLDGLDAAIILGMRAGDEPSLSIYRQRILGLASFQGGWATAGLGV